AKLAAHVAAGGQVPANFAGLLSQPAPPVPLLELVKDFAKKSEEKRKGAAAQNPAEGAGPLPANVATVLYYASIIAARVKCGVRISKWDDARLRQGAQWALEQPWVDEPLRELFRAGLQTLRTS